MVDTGVKVVEGTAALLGEECIISDGLECGCAEWSVHAVEEFQEQDADTEALRGQTVALSLRDFDDQALGAQFGQVVAQLAQTIRGRGQAESFGGPLMQIACPETSAAAEMGEARERLHDGQQAGIVELRAG